MLPESEKPDLTAAGWMLVTAIYGGMLTAFLAIVIALAIRAEGAEPDPLTRWGTPEGTVMVDIPGQMCGAFDGRSRNPRWKLEYLTTATLRGEAQREAPFVADLRIPAEFRATNSDYRGGGYDRGHQGSAANHPHVKDQAKTFLLSNMVPQCPELNRNLWNHLEAYVRTLTADGAEVWVLTCPLYLPGDGHSVRVRTIGEHLVWIPTHCGKAVLHLEAGSKQPRLRTWIIPNDVPPLGTTYADFPSTVDNLEIAAGLDLWDGLPDEVEEALEAVQ